LPLPEYDGRNELHQRIVAVAAECEALAAS
jgi:hypothetical protein